MLKKLRAIGREISLVPGLHNYTFLQRKSELHWKYGLIFTLTHWGRVTHICVVDLTIIASDNDLSPGRRQAIIWTSAGILLIGPLGTNFCEMLIEIHTFSFKKIHFKMASGKWRPFCLGLNVLRAIESRWSASGWHGGLSCQASSFVVPETTLGWYGLLNYSHAFESRCHLPTNKHVMVLWCCIHPHSHLFVYRSFHGFYLAY